VAVTANTHCAGSGRDRLERSRVRRRAVLITAFVGLSLATAEPAFASDGIPLPEVPAPPEIATAPAPPVPTLPPASESEPATTEPEPPVSVDVDVDGGDIDVSVRVLSPGEDAAEPAVVSGSSALDTTPTPTSAESLDDAQGSNTNVTVRVLSPGDNGPVDQGDALGRAEATAGGAASTGAPKSPDAMTSDGAVEAAVDPPSATKEREQYHEEDSRYQSAEQFTDDAWIWLWYLSLDCDGNASSSSTETGSQSSRDWTWNWTWEWSCNSPPRPPPLAPLEEGGDGEPERAQPAEGGAPATAASQEGQEGAGPVETRHQEPWRWTWTFTFCGETVSATLPIAPEAELRWVWDWIWTWTCNDEAAAEPVGDPSAPSAGDPAPSPATGVPGDTSGGGASTDEREIESRLAWITRLELPAWLIPLLPSDLSIAIVRGLGPLADVAPSSTIVDVAPVPPFFGAPAPALPAPRTPVALEEAMISPGPSRQQPHHPLSPTVDGGLRSGAHESPTAEPRLEKAPPEAKRRPRSRSGDSSLPPWPPLRPFQAAGGPGASSSFVPGASVLGTAALVALFVLAAPLFGRRVRVARELRPRGELGSSIDHPG
jgi:hypothetical protein